jgi:hypothetical protein
MPAVCVCGVSAAGVVVEEEEEEEEEEDAHVVMAVGGEQHNSLPSIDLHAAAQSSAKQSNATQRRTVQP